MRHLKIPTSLFLFASALAAGAQSTNWVAFNDYAPSTLTAPNVTGYTNRITGDGGVLTNFLTGEELPAAIMVEGIGTQAADDFGANSYPDAGSPSYNLFNGIIDLGNPGLPGLRSASADGTLQSGVILIFTNLDSSQRYTFRGTVSRGNPAYVNRWSFFSIRAAGFTDAHVDGSPNMNIFTAETFPAAAGSLAENQVALNSGGNTNGSLVGWDDIQPDAEGTFSITGQRYLGPTPFGNAADAGTAYGYGINAWMLAEISTGPPAAPSIVAEPVDIAVGERQTAVLRVSAAGTGPLRYQWHRGTPPSGTPVGGATRSTFRVVNTTGSGATWSLPEDSGQYYAIVSGAIAPPVTSRAATVTVTPDTTPPAFSYAACTTNANEIVVSLMEPLENTAADNFPVLDPLNWRVEGLGGAAAIGTLSVVYADGDTNVYLTTTPRDPSVGYRIVTDAEFHDRALARNLLPVGSSVGVVCFDTELVSMTAEWLVNDADVNPGPTWIQDDFDDGGLEWRRGPGPFDAKRRTIETDPDCRVTALHNLGAVGTCINLTSPVTGTNLIVAYFRTRFQFAGDPKKTILRLNGKLDDGGVVYLNGTELTRIGMPSPAVIGHDTFALRGVGDTDPQDVADFYYPTTLRAGENLLAVSLHQVNLTSSDLTMGLRVSSAIVQPSTLQIRYASPNVVINWAPAGGILQHKNDITGAWQDVTPPPAAGGPYTVPATSAAHFYRLR